MKIFTPLTKLCALIVVVLIITTAAFAQSQATTRYIEGRVLDPKEAVVPGATVTVTNQQTGLEKTTTSDTEGNYRIILLPPGPYTVHVSGPGFKQSELRDVNVTVGSKTALDVSLSVGGTTETVTITGESPVVET